MFKFILLFVCSIVFVPSILAQNTYPYGKFSIKEFKTDEYKGTAQNWDIIQNNENFVFIANSTGVLLYDGENWKRIKLNNEEEARSLAKGEHNEIYVGGINELGKVTFDKNGKLKYTKISQEIKQGYQFITWKTIVIKNQVYFITFNEIFSFSGDSLTGIFKVPESNTIEASIHYKNKIFCNFINKNNNQSYIFDGSGFKLVNNSEDFKPKGIFTVNNLDYLIDEKGSIKELISKNNTYSLINLDLNLDTDDKLDINCITFNKNMIAVGTHNKGIYLFTKKGKFIRSFTEDEGLVNEQIINLLFDHSNNLWSVNDNGIFLIDLSNSITTFTNKEGVSATTEDFYFTDKNEYIATHKDLFKTEIINNKKYFKSTQLFAQEIYQIKNFTFSDKTSKTIVIANAGLFILDDTKKEIIGDIWAWDLYQSKSNPDEIWLGLDGNDGVGLLTYNNGKFNFRKIKNTSGEVRKILEFNDKVYYSVKNEGIHILDTTKNQNQNTLKGLIKYDSTASYQQYTLELFQNKIYVGTDNGLYYINKNETLVPLKNGLTKKSLKFHRLFNDNNEKLWVELINESDTDNENPEIGYLTFNESKINLIKSPFIKASQEVIHAIKKDNNGYIWFGGISNINVYNPNNTVHQDSFFVYISEFSNKKNILYNYVHYSKSKKNTIPYSLNTIKFKFSTPEYNGLSTKTYKWYLEGLDATWSDFSNKNEIEYPRLHEGTYTFKVKSKNYNGFESKVTSITFTILPPWYRTWWAYLIYFLLLIGLIVLITKLSIKRVKDQNTKLEKIVDERTAEVEHQKHEIEEKNRDIVDSIKYAKRIQNTILPSDEKLNNILNSHFVIYKPKDIVSGDFYWAEKLDDKSYIAAIDCTGHGVPGAFVSIVGFNGLKRTVNEFKHRTPGKILDKLTDIVIDTFTASESHLKDGMDMALCAINYATLELEFAGANNPLILIRNGEILETKGNKQPIGDFDNRVNFTNHKVQLKKGDSVFLFTDGFADQFGGPKGKKFKLKTLKNLLLDVSNLPIKEQKEALEKAFNDWKGELEQLDDVCLIGLKF